MPSDALGFVVKVLAVIGGGAVGGFLIGWFMYMVVLTTMGQKMPGFMTWTCRALGGIICGWVVWLFVFGGGGSGLGGSGGTGTGSTTEGSSKNSTDDTTTPAKPTGLGMTESGNSLTIEILGEPDIERIDPARLKKGDVDHCYRFLEGDRSLLDLKAVIDAIETRKTKTPPLQRLILIRYKDTPGDFQNPVARLKSWAVQERLSVEEERKATMIAPLK